MADEIYVFGSLVRGEVGSTSDVDVLVVPVGLKPCADYPRAWSTYSRQSLQTYHSAGRLFAWHLWLEAKCVFTPLSRAWLHSLGPPAPYASWEDDIDELAALLAQSIEQLRAGTSSPIFEAGVVYTALRDIAMSASFSLLASPSFSARAPYLLPIECPVPERTYRQAMLARHSSTRGVGWDGQDIADTVAELCDAPVAQWIEHLKARLCQATPS
jgi:hypothetical protein